MNPYHWKALYKFIRVNLSKLTYNQIFRNYCVYGYFHLDKISAETTVPCSKSTLAFPTWIVRSNGNLHPKDNRVQ